MIQPVIFKTTATKGRLKTFLIELLIIIEEKKTEKKIPIFCTSFPHILCTIQRVCSSSVMVLKELICWTQFNLEHINSPLTRVIRTHYTARLLSQIDQISHFQTP